MSTNRFWSQARRLVFVGLAVTGVGTGGLGCGGGDEQEAPEVIRPVRYQEVRSGGSERLRSFTGVSRAGLESRLSFKVPGTVREIDVAVGDAVTAGQLLARLDPGDLRLQKEEADASLRRQEAQERNALADYDRIRGLYENGHASLGELDRARAGYESSAAAVRSAEKALELATSQLGYARLSAPVDGSISAVQVEENENVQAGQTVVVLTSGKEPEVEVAVPELLISRIQEGAPVQVRFDALAGSTFGAVVTEVGVTPRGATTTFPVTVRLDSAPEAIRPGMAAEVTFSFETKDERDRIVVPTVAVAEDRAGRFVYVIDGLQGDVGTAHRRTVEIGTLDSDGLEVLSGLSDGVLLVTAGVHKIQDGQKVRVPGAAGVGGATTGMGGGHTGSEDATGTSR